jgi:pimeloyl-ACP methyl ester carboxylesterase
MWDVPFERYNRLSPQLGFPFEVCTNINNAERFYLNTDVLMTNGYVRISLEDVTGEFKIWLPGWSDAVGNWHDCETLLDSGTKRVRYMSMRQWKNILRRYWETTSLEVRVTSSAAGSCKLKLEYLAADGDSYVHDFAEQRITSLNPLLLVDYNRDGKIDSVDVEYWMLGRKFRYWVNECKVKGAIWEEPSLFEAIAGILVGIDNWRNQHVDGTYDLINLFPIAVDFGPFLSAWGNELQFKITTEYGEDIFNYTFANINHSSAGSIRTSPQVDINNNSLTNAALAILERDGIIIPKSRAMSYGQNSCLMVAEARKVCDCNLKISVLVQGTEMYCCKLPVKTSSVDEMFRFVNIRGAYENEMTQFSGVAAPLNNPDYELADKDVFFVHGFNVDFDGAKNWNREMFKRFWVSGMNARYWGVTWSGDYHVISEKFNGLHYHRDVRQALLTAPTFRNLVNVHGRDAVVIGHSLGNMVVSEALLKGANARAYIMLDAAVASEAYRPELQADSMEVLDKYVQSDWDGYNERSWASNWYTWFTNDVADARGKIGWAGHFAPLLNKDGLEVYNFYSTGDEVFEEASEVPGLVSGVFHWPTFSFNWPFINIDLTLDAYPWQKQEVFKGVNAAGSLSAGWGFHCWSTNINSETVWMKHSAADANAMVADGSIVTNAVFDRGVSAMFKTAMTDFEVADILAFHIPAVSSPAGKVAALNGEETNFDLNGRENPNGWGRNVDKISNSDDVTTNESTVEYPWLHSDIKNMAYFYIYPAFNQILEKGNLK